MTWFKCGGGGVAEKDIIPLSLDDAVVTKQNNRITPTITNNKIVSSITNSADCMANISVPLSVPDGYNAVLVKYTLCGLSQETGYSATLYFSTYSVANASQRIANFNNKVLVQKNIAIGGASDGPHFDALEIPTGATHFNFQCGTSSFESAEIYACKVE